MNRRNFLKLTMGALAGPVVAASVIAEPIPSARALGTRRNTYFPNGELKAKYVVTE